MRGAEMTKATNDRDFAAAVQRAEARRLAEESLSPEDQSFLNALKQRWFPMGKTEDYALVKKMFIESRGTK